MRTKQTDYSRQHCNVYLDVKSNTGWNSCHSVQCLFSLSVEISHLEFKSSFLSHIELISIYFKFCLTARQPRKLRDFIVFQTSKISSNTKPKKIPEIAWHSKQKFSPLKTWMRYLKRMVAHKGHANPSLFVWCYFSFFRKLTFFWFEFFVARYVIYGDCSGHTWYTNLKCWPELQLNNMAVIECATCLIFICICLPGASAIMPSYIPVTSGSFDHNSLIERYFSLGFSYSEIVVSFFLSIEYESAFVS